MYLRKQKLCLLLGIFFLYNYAFAQFENVIHLLGIENITMFIIEDDSLWLAKEDGSVLNVDKTDFTIQNEINSVFNGHCNSICIDGNRNKWFATSMGLYKYSTNESVSSYFVNEPVNDLIVDELGNVWAGTSRGVYYFDGTVWNGCDETSTYQITALAIDAAYAIIAGTSTGEVLEYKWDKWSNYSNNTFMHTPVRVIAPTKENWLCIADDSGAFLCNHKTYRNLQMPEKIQFIAPDRLGDYWMGGDKSLFFVKKDTIISYEFTAQFGNYSLKDFALDFDGTRYFLTESGLYKLEDDYGRGPYDSDEDDYCTVSSFKFDFDKLFIYFDREIDVEGDIDLYEFIELKYTQIFAEEKIELLAAYQDDESGNGIVLWFDRQMKNSESFTVQLRDSAIRAANQTFFTCTIELKYSESVATDISTLKNVPLICPTISNGEFTIQCKNGIKEVSLFTLQGERIFYEQYNDQHQITITINDSIIEEGMYIVSIITETNEVINKKIIVKK